MCNLLPTGRDTQVSAYMQRWASQTGGEDPELDEWCLLVAFESAISDQAINRLDSVNRLFSQANPSGRIPAEGACAVLLVADACGGRLNPAQTVTLHRCALAKRATSVLAKGRVSGELLAELSARALGFSALNGADIGCILNDGGVHSAQGIETGKIIIDSFAHLDRTSDCLSVGTACGDLGPAATLASLALARARFGTIAAGAGAGYATRVRPRSVGDSPSAGCAVR